MAENSSFDVIVIGGGPGGYVAAIRAAQLGKSTAVVEKDKAGGRCLNYACIPAKTMLHTAEVLDEAKNSAEIGVKVTGAELDWDALGQRRTDVSASLEGGVNGLFKKNKIEFIAGEGSLTEDGNVKVGDTTYQAGKVIVATGSGAQSIPGVEFSERVLDTWGAWSVPEQPKSIAVVGAGASGAELASAYIRFGTEVKLIEMLDQILPAEDKDVVRVVERTFKKQGIEVSTGTPVENVEVGKDSVKFTYGDNSAEVDYLMIAGGRVPDIGPLGLGWTATLRGNFHNWKVSVTSYDGPVDIDHGMLFRPADTIHPAYCEGFPKDHVFGSYAADRSRFTVEVYREHEVFTLMYLLSRWSRRTK